MLYGYLEFVRIQRKVNQAQIYPIVNLLKGSVWMLKFTHVKDTKDKKVLVKQLLILEIPNNEDVILKTNEGGSNFFLN